MACVMGYHTGKKHNEFPRRDEWFRCHDCKRIALFLKSPLSAESDLDVYFYNLNIGYSLYLEMVCCGVYSAHILVTVTGWYRTKRPMQLRPSSDLLYPPYDF
jgi:hypothetical protein